MESGTVTRVLKDVHTTMDGELSLMRGDIFQVIEIIDKYWCYGNSSGRIGKFPCDQLIPIETPEVKDSEQLFLAIADFPGEQDGDLKFYKGEFIIGENKLDEHWWQGRITQNRRGVFPDTFTWHLSSTSQKVKKKSNVMNVMARVKMSLKAQLDEEMDLHIGDIVTILEETDKGWYRGVCGTNSGIFPAAYVTLLEDNAASSLDCSKTYAQDNREYNGGGSSSSKISKNNSVNNNMTNNNDRYCNIESESSMKDLMTFSPEKEVKPVVEEKPTSMVSELEILNDDYFKVNMPSYYSGSSGLETDNSGLQTERSSSGSSYLTELVSELDDGNIQPYGMTLYPFYAQYANELSFHENEIVHLIRHLDDEWLEGEIDGRKGIFPVSYVNILVDCDRGWKGTSIGLEDIASLSCLSPRSYAKVMYSFDAQMNGDLSVKEGDIVMVMKIVDQDWCEVRNQSGNTGLCPSNHLAPHNESDTSTLFRSSSFTSNLEPLLASKPLPRTFEPHDFAVEYRKKPNKVEDLISKNLSGLDIIPVKRKSPVGRGFIDFKEELSETMKKESDEHSNNLEESFEIVEVEDGCKPPSYPPPPPPSEMSASAKVSQDAPLPPEIPYKSKPKSDGAASVETAPPAPERPQRPPPPARRTSIDRAPHRPAPPVPIAGQTPVRRSLKRLPRQTSAPCVLSDETNDAEEIQELIMKKEKQLQIVREEIETELEQSEESCPRSEELQQCGALYDRKMKRLKMDIQHYREKLDLAEAHSSTSQSAKLKTSDNNEEKRKKMKEQRQNVISELVMTEKEYVRDLKMTYEVFNLHNPTMLQERGINVKALFGNILEVMQAAEEFLDSLQFAMKGKSDENQCVGPVFLKHADLIKKVYSEYCANHENALGLLEKYKTIPAAQAVFDKAMETLRYQVTCFNVGSVLIKPVQRLLKYPLMLNELIKCTEDQHKDKSDLLKAVQVYTNMASDINEFKRRKDIVSKYLGDGTSTLVRKMAKLNYHSVAKKSSRLSAKLSSSLGLSLAPKDELFLEQERSFHSLEKTLRIFLRNLDVLLNHLQEEVVDLFHLSEALGAFYMERKNDQDVDEFRTTQRLIMNNYWQDFKTVVERRVTTPLMSLLELFEGPCMLIEKRNDKLLDYDNCLAKADKNKENRQLQEELFKSKTNYEALNHQLLEDLPKLIESSTEILVECLSALLAAQKLFSGKITKQYLNLMEIPSLSLASGDAIEAFAVKHYLVCNQLGRLSFCTKSFKESGGNNRKSLKTSPTPARQLGTDGQKLSQSTSQRAFLQSKYPSDKLYCVVKDHVAAGPLDLSISTGHLVAVIKKQDPMGNSTSWFVDNGGAQGFVRQNCLEPAPAANRHSLSPSSSNNSSISSCATPSPNKLRPDSALSRRSSDSDHSPRQSLPPRKTSAKQPAPSQAGNLPPSYEEVTGTSNSSNLYDEVHSETVHRYDEVPNTDVDNTYEQIQTVNEIETPDDLDSSCESEFYYCLYDFDGMGNQTLPVKCGQVVKVLKMKDLKGNEEWWYVEDRYENKGFVPANYLHPYADS
ncbi:dynamin-binding protein-like isoform X2 [Thrips palmi]|uniref:Dynamin-binding protein-like isoform X2 n=1 Tax=Thrips palmi TaxID=161013 RepID=A0A6P8ZGZ7_THRPL|nr:dynamin-binding protein-like isoform X2 [Thrips palmi]